MPSIWTPRRTLEPGDDPDIVELVVPVGPTLVDLVGGTIGTLTAGSQPTQVITDRGEGLRFAVGSQVTMPRHVFPWDLDGPATESAQTIVAIVRTVSNTNSWQSSANVSGSAGFMGLRRTGTTNQYHITAEGGSGLIVSATESGVTNLQWISGAVSAALGRGAAVLNSAGSEVTHARPWSNPTTSTVFGASISFDFLLFARINRYMGLDELRERQRDEWRSLFQQRSQALYFDAGSTGTGTQNLAGDATSTASAGATLSVVVPLAGAGIVVATSSGAMSIGIPLAATAQSQAVASGDLSTAGSASLTGNATATASAGGSLSLTIPLGASAVAQALAAAGLTHGTPLAGGAAAQGSAGGALTLNVSLAGNAIAQAAATGGLAATSASSMAANAAAQAAASGALTHGVPLSGAALMVSAAGANITHIVPVAGAAAVASLATGGLDVSVSLQAAALVQALASAGLSAQGNANLAGGSGGQSTAQAILTLRINLDADAMSAAIASGALAGTGELVGTPGYKVSRSPRAWRVSRSARTWRVAA